MAETVQTLQKNKREQLRVALDTYQGVNLVDLRVVVPLSEVSGVPTPTKKGVSLNVALLPELISALESARGMAVAKGWLD